MAETGHTPFDRLLDGVVRVLQERKNPTGLVQRCLRRTRAGLAILSWGWLCALALLLASMEWRGERMWVLSFLLYLPAQVWVLPSVALIPFCLLFRPKLCLIHLGVAVLVLVVYMGPQWSHWPTPRGDTLTLLTNNRGEANRTSPTRFIEEQKPDIVALQEAGREYEYKQAYPDLHVKAAGEFTLISRHPIQKAELLDITLKSLPVGARFEVDCGGRTLVLYNVHFTSPRRDLDLLRGLGFPVLLFAPAGSRYGRVREEYKASWEERMEAGRRLAERIAAETLPCVAVGDFNFPDHGYAYHLFAAQLTDCFAARGRGYGFTVPGTTRNPLSLFGPWLRLDYIWSGAALRPVSCAREPGRHSQHRAVVATLEWAEDK